MRSIDRKFYADVAWEKCRAAYFIHVGGLCERCRSAGRLVPGDIVHHKIHLTDANMKDPAIAYDFQNLELLCNSCHNKEHFGSGRKKRYKINEDGSIVY